MRFLRIAVVALTLAPLAACSNAGPTDPTSVTSRRVPPLDIDGRRVPPLDIDGRRVNDLDVSPRVVHFEP